MLFSVLPLPVTIANISIEIRFSAIIKFAGSEDKNAQFVSFSRNVDVLQQPTETVIF